MNHKILIIEDERIMRITLEDALKAEGYEVSSFEKGRDGIEALKKEDYSLVITDIRLPDINGLDLLKLIKEEGTDAQFIMMTAYGTIKNAVEAIKNGAFDYITKPFSLDELRLIVKRALEIRDVREENIRLKRQLSECIHYPDLIGESRAMKEVFQLIQRVAKTDAPVLILGESGTGKELVASAIHHHSNRKDKPLVKVNCAAIPENLIESELFGYEKGAFTGATRRKPGRFELADGGTIFLDEIGDMAPMTQSKILRVLQDSTFERLGGNRTVKVDVRVIAATNRNLAEEVGSGRFREDLYHRLNVFTIKLPPLRERKDDIPPLVEHFIRRFNSEKGYSIKSITPEAIEALQKYSWPGNVRELENTIWRALIIASGNVLEKSDLIFPELNIQSSARDTISSYINDLLISKKEKPYDIVIQMVEKELIKRALDLTKTNQVKASELLGITRVTLRKKIEQFGL
jgi:nitrogen regulation protein NR(I)